MMMYGIFITTTKISPETYKVYIMKNNGNSYRLGGYKHAHNFHG